MHQQPLSGRPPEDAGAATADRYRFQYCCAASRLLAAIAESRPCSVICEWHEDYLVLRDDGSIEAVSVKHREDSLPPWTLATLAGSEGKLLHLLDTFRRAGRQIDCCFESNRPSLVSDLFSSDHQERDAARDELARRLTTSRDEIDAFVARLTVSRRVPSRADIEDTYAERYAVPAMDALGIAGLPAARAIAIARNLIADASAERLSVESTTAVLVAAPGDRPAVAHKAILKARQVDQSDLADALQQAASTRVPRLQTPEGASPPETTMPRKLIDGGLGDSTVETAQRRRRSWFSHRARYRDIPHRQEELNSLTEWVQDEANAAESVALDSGEVPYGRVMHRELITRLRDRDALPSGTRAEDSDPALLSGAAYQLTDDCSVWFSPRPAAPSTDV